MFLLLTIACTEQVEQTCIEDPPRVLATDEALDFGGTLDDLVAAVDSASFAVYDLAGATHLLDAALVLTGDATLVDREVHEEIVRPGGPNRSITWLVDGTCYDEVSAPVTLTLADADGLVAIEAEATLTATEGGFGIVTAVDGGFDPAAATFPAGFHDDPTEAEVLLDLASDVDPHLVVWVTAADGAEEAVLTTWGQL